MQLYKFTLIFSTNEKETITTLCKYPKKTSVYRSCKTLLGLGTLKSFNYVIINN